MLVLVAWYECKPGEGDAVAEALARVAPIILAEEPGCTRFDVCRGRENPEHFLLYEHYVDEAALAVHRETPHFKQIIEGEIVPRLAKRERVLYNLIAA
ncbi:MAG: antibiotic biosynthesis monooxygenase [Oscillochloris sp.]|nr:antibiotic biosynthesis monooxygenase [Oscillochloris sp.]